MELAIGSVAIIAIILLVIIVIVSFFLGGFGRASQGLTDISQQGEKGAGELNLEFKCLGTPRMTDAACKALDDKKQTSYLCSGKTAKKDGKCIDFGTADKCNDISKARGCYWGYGQ